MTIKEKIQLSESSNVNIHLFKEGVFWTAYEQSAYLISQVKPYRLTKRFVKILSREIVSIGFPDTALEQIIFSETITEISRTDMYVVLQSSFAIEETVFNKWKDGIELQSTVICSKGENKSTPTIADEIVNKIRFFDLSNATPMKCMMFLGELKKELYGYL